MADEEKVKYSKLENRANVLEVEVKALKTLNDEMVLRYKKDSAALIFNTLVKEGYDVDETDKAMLTQFSIDNQTLHADKIRLKYKKAPVGETGELEEALKYAANGAPQGVQSPEDATKVAELALKDGISYTDAEAKMYGKTK